MNAFEKLKERLEEESQYSCFHCMDRAISIVSEVEAEYGNGWIPCSERLPEENKFYAVTIFDGEEYRTEPAYYARFGYLGQRGIRAQWWTDCTSNADLIEEDDDKVIAWMPLPSPYTPTTD